MIPEASDLLNNKLGVHFGLVESNRNAAFPTLYRPLTPEQHAAMQSHVDNIYDLFTGRVAEGRSMPVDSVRAIAEGRVWIGGAALRLGLVDEIGGIDEAIYAIASETGLDADNFEVYPKNEDNLWAAILRESKALDAARAAAGFNPLERRAMRVAEWFVEQNPVQARMPMVIVR